MRRHAKLIFTIALAALTATQATALSCLRPELVPTYERLAAAEESYFVLYGELTFDEAALPPAVGTENDLSLDPIPGHFIGAGLTKQGFTSDYVSDVLLEVNCAGPWCGTAQSGVAAIFFVPFSDPPARIQADPCGTMIFYQPSDADLAALESCMATGSCQPGD